MSKKTRLIRIITPKMPTPGYTIEEETSITIRSAENVFINGMAMVAIVCVVPADEHPVRHAGHILWGLDHAYSSYFPFSVSCYWADSMGIEGETTFHMTYEIFHDNYVAHLGEPINDWAEANKDNPDLLPWKAVLTSTKSGKIVYSGYSDGSTDKVIISAGVTVAKAKYKHWLYVTEKLSESLTEIVYKAGRYTITLTKGHLQKRWLSGNLHDWYLDGTEDKGCESVKT